MLLVPYLTGVAAVAGAATPQIFFGLAGVLLLFISRPPLMLLLKRKVVDGSFGDGSRSLWLNFTIFAAAGLAVFSLITVVHGMWQLPLLGGASLVMFILHTAQALRRRERSAAGEFIGVAMLTVTAPLAVYLSCGELFVREAAMLWLLSALYFGASIYFIKMFMRAAAWRGKRLTLGEKLSLGRNSLAYLAAGAAVLTVVTSLLWVPAYAFIAFAPIYVHVVRNVFTLRPGMNLKLEGFIQAGLSLAWAGLLIMFYRV